MYTEGYGDADTVHTEGYGDGGTAYTEGYDDGSTAFMEAYGANIGDANEVRDDAASADYRAEPDSESAFTVTDDNHYHRSVEDADSIAVDVVDVVVGENSAPKRHDLLDHHDDSGDHADNLGDQESKDNSEPDVADQDGTSHVRDVCVTCV